MVELEHLVKCFSCPTVKTFFSLLIILLQNTMTTWTFKSFFFLFYLLGSGGYSVGAEKYDDNDEVNLFCMSQSLLVPARLV